MRQTRYRDKGLIRWNCNSY